MRPATPALATFAAGAAAWSHAACAADAAAGPALLPSLVQTLFGLGLVLALIWGAAWAIRRVAPAAARPGTFLKTIATLPVGQRERVVVVEVGEQWLVLGVCAGGIQALSTLPKGELPQAPPPVDFSRLFARARGTPPSP